MEPFIDIETLIAAEPDRGEQFTAACAAIFQTAEGKIVLATLAKFAHPTRSPLRSTAEHTHVSIGRKEIVTALFVRQDLGQWTVNQNPSQDHGSTVLQRTSRRTKANS